MSPRVLVPLAAVALLGAVSAAAWALTRPAEEREVPPIRIESPAQLREAAGIEEEQQPRERRRKAREEDRERRGGFAPAPGDEGAQPAPEPTATPPPVEPDDDDGAEPDDDDGVEADDDDGGDD